MNRRNNMKADRFAAQTREQQIQAKVERGFADMYQKKGYTEDAKRMFEASKGTTQKAMKSQSRFKKYEAKSPQRQEMKKNFPKIYGKGY